MTDANLSLYAIRGALFRIDLTEDTKVTAKTLRDIDAYAVEAINALAALSAPDAGLVSERDEARARAERAEGRLREISDLLEDAGVPGGTTLYGGVMMLRERAERAEADAGLVEVVREYRNALASYTDGRNDLVECDERTRKAHDALLAFPLPAPGAAPADEVGWVIERDIDSTLHYWTGRVIDYREDTPGQWSPDHRLALRLSRRTDAESLLTWQCGGVGRVVEHMWATPEPSPEEMLTACEIGREAIALLAKLEPACFNAAEWTKWKASVADLLARATRSQGAR